MLYLGDATFFYSGAENEEQILIETGRRVFFNTGSDGEHYLQVRIVDVSEPVLSLKEYRRVTTASEIFTVTIPSGELTITDYCTRPELLSIKIQPGTYKVCIYVFILPRQAYSYYVCLAPTENTVTAIHNEPCIPVLEPW